MAVTKIEWTGTPMPDGTMAPGFTFNPWEGCSRISKGCENCYAELRAARFGTVQWGPQGTRRVASKSYWKQPLKWDREAKAAGIRKRVFCASLADVFEDWRGVMSDARGRTVVRGDWQECLTSHGEPLTMDYFRFELFNLIRRTPGLDWLLLTKRPENVARMTAEFFGAWNVTQMPNVWLGTSVENQDAADARIPHLLKAPAAVRFLSVEPMLGPVDLLHVDTGGTWPGKSETAKLDCLRGFTSSRREKFVLNGITEEKGTTRFVDTEFEGRIGWVIVGSESGPKRRPMYTNWAASLLGQCKAAGVAFFMKQLEVDGKVTGDLERFPEGLRVRQFPEAQPA